MTSKLEKLGCKTYSDYLKTEHWKTLKKAFISSDTPKHCSSCHTKKKLSIHHNIYKRLGQEASSDLTYLCRRCHYDLHKRKIKRVLEKKETRNEFSSAFNYSLRNQPLAMINRRLNGKFNNIIGFPFLKAESSLEIRKTSEPCTI